MTRILACVSAVTATLGFMVAAAQQPVFRGTTDAVHVFVTVTDRDGRLVTTLARDDFELRDEGKPQPITLFDNTPHPIRLIVMLDLSGSMAAAQVSMRYGLTGPVMTQVRVVELAPRSLAMSGIETARIAGYWKSWNICRRSLRCDQREERGSERQAGEDQPGRRRLWR